MTSKKYNQMSAFQLIHNDMPDGAFFALAEDVWGWDNDDWINFSTETERREIT